MSGVQGRAEALSADERETIRTAGNPATAWQPPDALYRADALRAAIATQPGEPS